MRTNINVQVHYMMQVMKDILLHTIQRMEIITVLQHGRYVSVFASFTLSLYLLLVPL